ncbi:MAG: hypothetical protein OER87_19285, partial [Gammaproteobacteria bacterium]|nr:hypothetical protein [Gammaproteobacteria bacterium]
GFIGLGGSLKSLDDDFDTVDPVNGLLRAGYAINEYLEIGRGGLKITLLPDEVADVDFEVDTTFFSVQVNAPLGGG